jgi:hypothetical protein
MLGGGGWLMLHHSCLTPGNDLVPVAFITLNYKMNSRHDYIREFNFETM